MLKIKLQSIDVIITLDTTVPNEPVNAIYEGESQRIDFVKSEIDDSYGVFGHRVSSKSITPIDLHKILFTSLADFSPEILEGKEIVSVYDPDIPQGAKT